MDYRIVTDEELRHIDAVDDDNVVGTIGYRVVDGDAIVERLWVHPTFEKQGIGAALIVQTLAANNVGPRSYSTDGDIHMVGLSSAGLTPDGLAFVESVIGPLGFTKEVA